MAGAPNLSTAIASDRSNASVMWVEHVCKQSERGALFAQCLHRRTGKEAAHTNSASKFEKFKHEQSERGALFAQCLHIMTGRETALTQTLWGNSSNLLNV